MEDQINIHNATNKKMFPVELESKDLQIPRNNLREVSFARSSTPNDESDDNNNGYANSNTTTQNDGNSKNTNRNDAEDDSPKVQISRVFKLCGTKSRKQKSDSKGVSLSKKLWTISKTTPRGRKTSLRYKRE